MASRAIATTLSLRSLHTDGTRPCSQPTAPADCRWYTDTYDMSRRHTYDMFRSRTAPAISIVRVQCREPHDIYIGKASKGSNQELRAIHTHGYTSGTGARPASDCLQTRVHARLYKVQRAPMRKDDCALRPVREIPSESAPFMFPGLRLVM